MTAAHELIAVLDARAAAMVESLRELVSSESPSSEPERCRGTASLLARQARDAGLAARVVDHDGRPHVLIGGIATEGDWADRPSPGQVLLLGHLDTVWPVGTLAERPFALCDGVAVGPGIYDMKAGIVQGLHALVVNGRAGGDTHARPGMLVTSDEEIGSRTSKPLIEDLARRSDAVLVLEPGPHGGVKIARKGFASWKLTVHGRAAHAGLEPERGINAGVEIARQMLAIASLGEPRTGTTVTPTTLVVGSASNTVPELAELMIDVRSGDPQALRRVEDALRALEPHGESVLDLCRVSARPPLTEAAGAELFERAQEVAAALGLDPLTGAAVGGVSDGNLTAAVGAPTLDGLGAVGDGAHARSERVSVDEMPRRAALVAGLLDNLIRHPVRSSH